MAREFRVRNMVRLRESPHADAPSPLGTVSLDDVVTILSEQGEWSEVRVVDEAGNVRTGFVRMSMLAERPPLTPSEEEAIDEASFALALTFSARTFGVNRDYLIAVAWVESRIKNVTNETTGAMGPFQFMPSTWASLVVQHGQQEDITERDIVKAGKQAVFAAIHTAKAQDQLLGKLGRLPTGGELYVAHRLGLPAALEVLATDRAMPIDRALLPVFQGQADAAGAVRHLVDHNQALLKAGDQVKTVEGVLAIAADRLNEGLREAARIVALLPEDEQFVPRLAGEDGTASSVAQGARVKQAFDHLRREFTHDQAAGLVGNFMQESGESLDPTAFNEREGAIGIAQWRLGRRENLKAFAAQRGTTETDFHVQLEFVMHELNGREARAKTQIKACTTPEQAALAVREHYERAQPDHDSNRIAFAKKVADRFQII